MTHFNSLTPGWSGCEFKNANCKIVPLLLFLRSFHDNAFRWMPQFPTVDKLTSVQVMAWCHQAPSYYLKQCWSRSMSTYYFIRPQWVQILESYTKRLASSWWYWQISLEFCHLNFIISSMIIKEVKPCGLLMTWHKTVITPVLMLWSYHSLVPSHWSMHVTMLLNTMSLMCLLFEFEFVDEPNETATEEAEDEPASHETLPWKRASDNATVTPGAVFHLLPDDEAPQVSISSILWTEFRTISEFIQIVITVIYTVRPAQNGRHFADKIFKCIWK